MVHNTDEFTFKRPRQKPSVLDLCISSETMCPMIADVEVRTWFDSDHRPVLFTFDGGILKMKQVKPDYADI